MEKYWFSKIHKEVLFCKAFHDSFRDFFSYASSHSLTYQVVYCLLFFRSFSFLNCHQVTPHHPLRNPVMVTKFCPNTVSVWNFTLSMLYSIFLIKYKEIVVKDFLKSWFVSITRNFTKIAIPCYIRKSNLGQKSMKKVAPVSDAFFYSNCFAMYYHVCSYKNTSKAVGLLANMVLQHGKCLLETFYWWNEEWTEFARSHQRD